MIAVALLQVVFALTIPSSVKASVTPLRIQENVEPVISNSIKVPVVLGVQSRNQDALLCQSVFDQVLKRAADKVDLSFAYVADIDTSNPDFGVSCENGFSECAANVQQLCVHKYAQFNKWWQFVMCQDYQGLNRIGAADTAVMCTRSAQIDWDESGVGECIGLDGSGTGAEGVVLLQENVQASHAAGIDTSCTVIINNKPVCMHDDSWKQCEEGHMESDFIRQINAEWRKINNLMDDSFSDDDI